MISSVHDLMLAWGRWILRQESRKVGFPPFCPMFRDIPRGGAWGSSIPFGVFRSADDYEAVSAAVNRLCTSEKTLCFEMYVIGGGWRAVCRRAGISRSTLYKRLDKIQQDVSNMLAA